MKIEHTAHQVDDPAARDRLVKAGATAEGDVQETESGDVVAMVRDPWGIAVQLVRRKTPMIGRTTRS